MRNAGLSTSAELLVLEINCHAVVKFLTWRTFRYVLNSVHGKHVRSYAIEFCQSSRWPWSGHSAKTINEENYHTVQILFNKHVESMCLRYLQVSASALCVKWSYMNTWVCQSSVCDRHLKFLTSVSDKSAVKLGFVCTVCIDRVW